MRKRKTIHQGLRVWSLWNYRPRASLGQPYPEHPEGSGLWHRQNWEETPVLWSLHQACAYSSFTVLPSKISEWERAPPFLNIGDFSIRVWIILMIKLNASQSKDSFSVSGRRGEGRVTFISSIKFWNVFSCGKLDLACGNPHRRLLSFPGHGFFWRWGPRHYQIVFIVSHVCGTGLKLTWKS